MATGFNRAVIGTISRSKKERRLLLRAYRSHVARREAGLLPQNFRTRNVRLAFGQYLLCTGHDHPVGVVLAPLLALATYAVGVLLLMMRNS